ncbi:MAG: fibronectin type III domain-containing protein [candidate division Zixibacteria bacterium]|nr:fibronectin type III domain-containing protein [candidate division Zixibacteria bacterium]
MNKLLGIVLVGLLIIGCSRHIETEEPDVSPPTAPAVPHNLKIAHSGEDIELSWQVADAAGIDYYRVYYGSDSAVTALAEYDTTSALSIAVTGLATGQTYYFRVAAVTTGGLEGTLSGAVGSRAGMLSLSINGNDVYTDSRTVTISFIVPLTAQLVQLSEDIGFIDAVWQNYSSSRSFELSEGDGVKYVYGQFKFSDGSESSGPIVDSITLDTRAMIDSGYYLPAATVFGIGDTIMFYVDAGEVGGDVTISFPGKSSLVLFDDGSEGDVDADDGLFTRRFVVPVNLEVAGGIITASYTDEAGNRADSYTMTELLTIANPPTAVTLAANKDETAVTLSWTTSVDDDFASYRVYRRTGSADFTITEGSLLSVINSRGTTEYEDIPQAGYWSYKVFVFDEQGLNCGGSNHAAVVF